MMSSGYILMLPFPRSRYHYKLCMFKLTKRRRFVLSSILLTVGLFLIHRGTIDDRYLAIGILSLASFLLCLWSLGIPIRNQVWLFSWVLPFFFTASVSMFYFLLPASLLSLVPILGFYLVGMYVLLLSENIFFVTSIRTIQLYRSATAVSFLFSLITAFLSFDTILSFHLPFFANTALIFTVSFILLLHSLWTARLEEGMSSKVFRYSLVLAWAIACVGLIIAFWPVSLSQGSILLTALIYILIGTAQAKLNDRLFDRVVREYSVVGFIVLIVTIFSTRWG